MKLNVSLKQKMLTSLIAAGLFVTPFSISGSSGHVSAAAAVTQTIVTTVVVDGVKLKLNPPPVTLKGVTFVPMREIFKALHTSVTWEPNSRTIIAVKDRTTITLQIGSKQAVINGKATQLAEAPVQINGVTMVPLRFIAEVLGAEVKLNASNHIVTILSAESILKQKQDASDKTQAAIVPPVLTTKQIVAANDSKIVLVRSEIGQGSGVVIGKDQILTNYHVIVDSSKATITLLSGTQVEIAGIVGYNKDYDLAILQTKTPLNIQPAAIGYDASKGDHVVAIGSPLGYQNTVSDGVISNITYEGGTQYYQTSAPIDHGSSGGGLFNDYGQLIGITAAGVEDTQAHLNFAVTSKNIKLLLADIQENPPTKIGFLPKKLPTSLKGASNDKIRQLLEDSFSVIESKQGSTELKKFDVTRDADGWLVVTAVIDPSFYMLYGHGASDDMRYWAIDTGSKLRQMLPDENIQLTVYYDQVFSFQPRGFDAGQVTAVGDGTWRVRFPVIDFQGKEKAIVRVNA